MNESLTWYTSGDNMGAFVDPLLQRLVPILSSVKASPNLLENTAVTIGRLALAAPQKVAPHLGEIIRIWSQTMMHVSSGAEQDSALRGMCEAAKYNPLGVRAGGQFLLEALAKSENPSEELRAASAPVSALRLLLKKLRSMCQGSNDTSWFYRLFKLFSPESVSSSCSHSSKLCSIVTQSSVVPLITLPN